jgi:DNA-binding NtrC family response regulator
MAGKNRILIVDDETIIADTLATVFASEGYDSRAAYSAEQALRSIADWSPHLAIVDVQLREINGMQFALNLREQWPDCQVALFTGLMDLTDLLAQARESNQRFEVIQKPVHPAEMLRMVAGWLSGPEEPELSTA